LPFVSPIASFFCLLHCCIHGTSESWSQETSDAWHWHHSWTGVGGKQVADLHSGVLIWLIMFGNSSGIGFSYFSCLGYFLSLWKAARCVRPRRLHSQAHLLGWGFQDYGNMICNIK
jgi:hypothetical protein